MLFEEQGRSAMNAQNKMVSKAVVNLTVPNGPLNKDFQGGRELTDILEALLASVGYEGTFSLLVVGKLKGSPHTQGFQLGMPNPPKRSVEIKWQPGGNHTRYSLMLNAPHGVEPIDFHEALDKEIKKRDALVEATELKKPLAEQATLSLEEVELLLFELRPKATAAGVLMKQDIVDLLSRMGHTDPEVDVQSLVDNGYLRKGATKAFLTISSEWLEKLRDKPAYEAPVVLQRAEPEPANEALPPADEATLGETPLSGLLTEVARLSAIVEGNKRFEERHSLLTQEMATLEEQVAKAQLRIGEVRIELAEVAGSLGDPAVQHARETLQSLRKILG